MSKTKKRRGTASPHSQHAEPLQLRVRRICENPVTEYFVLFFIVAYIFVVFAQVVIDDPSYRKMHGDPTSALRVLNAIDFAILGVFLFECYIKIFAYGMKKYFGESKLIVFDAFIVHLSAIFLLLEMLGVGQDSEIVKRWSRVRGMLRLLRILIVFRKVNSMGTLINDPAKMIMSPAERVVAVLKVCHDIPSLHPVLRDDIATALHIISSDKLYEPISSPQQITSNPESGVNTEAAAWISNATRQANVEEKPVLRSSKSSSHFSKSPRTTLNASPKEFLRNDTELSSAPKVSRKKTTGRSTSLLMELGTKLRFSMRTESPEFPEFDFSSLGADWRELYSWSFNIWDVAQKYPEGLLSAMADVIFTEPSPNRTVSSIVLIDHLEIVPQTWHTFAKAIESNYLDNPYHNATHAADVLQTTASLSIGDGEAAFASQLSQLEIFGTLFAALIHDVQHPAVNNAFLSKSRHDIAVRYNDTSVLEMHHVATAYKIALTTAGCNIWETVPTNTYQAVRSVVVGCVLATDLTKHFADLGRFKSRMAAGDFLLGDGGEVSSEDRHIVMDMLVHSSDISNPTKNLDNYCRWTRRVLTEFFCQGDMEKENAFAVSLFMDRTTTNIAKCQVGFIDILVTPLFDALGQKFGTIGAASSENLAKNRAFWQQRIDKMEEEMTANTQVMPSYPPTPVPIGEELEDIDNHKEPANMEPRKCRETVEKNLSMLTEILLSEDPLWKDEYA